MVVVVHVLSLEERAKIQTRKGNHKLSQNKYENSNEKLKFQLNLDVYSYHMKNLARKFKVHVHFWTLKE